DAGPPLSLCDAPARCAALLRRAAAGDEPLNGPGPLLRIQTAATRCPTDRAERGFAVYVHWPFCLSKCPYCDFNSHVRAQSDEAGGRDALLAELDHFAAETRGRKVGSVFFGGGTPSLMAPATAGAVIARISRNWTLSEDAEI